MDRIRLRLIFIMLMLFALIFGCLTSYASAAFEPDKVGVTLYKADITSMPEALQAAFSAAVGHNTPSYAISKISEPYQAINTGHNLSLAFSSSGINIRSGTLKWGLRLKKIGYGHDLHSVALTAPKATANRVEYVYGGLTEWYVNGPLGLEQGFTIEHAPSDQRNGGPLTLELLSSGDLSPKLDGSGTGLLLTGHDGSQILRYSGLNAVDATGRQLKTWLELDGLRVLVHVNDTAAQYPVVVDPLIQQQELTATDALYFGSVALSADGNTALIGASGYNSYQGAVYVFTRSSSTWSQQQILAASDGLAGDHFGGSVALSADGSTALIAAVGKNIGNTVQQGAVYVFTRSGSTWSQQQELTASDGTKSSGFGVSIALSADGNTALIGAPNQGNNYNGAAYVFTRSGSTWMLQKEMLMGLFELTFCGESVALSADGNTALIGAPENELGLGYYGSLFVMTRSGSTWSLQQQLDNPSHHGGFGGSVALSADGNTALGVASTSQGPPAVYAFTRSGSTWAQQQQILAAYGGCTSGNCPTAPPMALSADGNTALIGASGYNSYQGAVYVFTRSGSTWAQQQILAASDGLAGDYFGGSVALTADGSTALFGAPGHNSFQGAAYIFNTLVFAVNAGGGQYTDAGGNVYRPDTEYSGGATYSTTAAISGTSDGTLYQTIRYGNFSYNIPLANGNYNVTLKFAEIYWNAPGKRVFNVIMQGQQVITDLDIYAEVGKNATYDVTIPVTVTNGMLTIAFTSVVDNAQVNGILVALTQLSNIPPSTSTVVFADNAGGGQYTDASGNVYQSDTDYVGGRTYSTSEAIAGTPDVALYQTGRYGNFYYNIPLVNGNYNVTLKFAEMYWNSPGQRVFDVIMQGQQVISNLDICAQVGPNATAYDVTIPVIVTNGVLNIAFVSVIDNAILSAIEIRQVQGSSTCTVSSSTVSITPASQNITSGGSGTYTINITNNDSGEACTSTTFSLAASDTNSTNFYSSTVSPASVTLLPGTSGNSTLTVTAKAVQTSGSDSTTVTATASGHATSISNAITTTITSTLTVLGTGKIVGGDGTSYQLIYDSAQNITWLDYSRPSSNWYDQQGWAQDLTVDFNGRDVNGWSLPTTVDSSSSHNWNSTSSQMAYLFYTGLGDIGWFSANNNPTAVYGQNALTNTGPFKNLLSAAYWSDTTYYANPGSVAWIFDFSDGGQGAQYKDYGNYALAVHSGEVTAPTAVFAVNAGGGQYTDASGNLYQADTDYLEGRVYSTAAPISGTADSSLYQNIRYGNFSYNIPLADGNYNVTLKFAEIYWDAPGQRIFNVIMQGQQVISNLDVCSMVGKNGAYDVTIPVTVANGMLNIVFVSVVDNAIVSAIGVTEALPGNSFFNNAGGGQYKDSANNVYQADKDYSGGSTYATTSGISGTPDAALYQTLRYGNFLYNIPLANGIYNVTLKFAEIYWNASGKRIFSVSMQGQQVISNLDIYSQVGANTAYDVTIPATVTNGVLNIVFTSVVDNAVVSAIEVQ